ncbi:MAG: glucose-6-phosphate isomerase family protein [Candidatus Doudnabacteria bacterium]
MINLQKISGLPMELSDDGHLKFIEPLKEVMPAVRKFTEMIPVLMDPAATPLPVLEDMYYMYRDVRLPEHEDLIRKNNLRFDITTLPAVMLGREFNKTVGHYHPVIPSQSLAYPELYEVLAGEALFLIQKMDAELKKLITVMAIRAKAGDKVIYPPNFGHIIVNVGSGVLATANWVSDKFTSLYEPVHDRHGMAYYVVKNNGKGYNFLPNPNYQDTPGIRGIEAFVDPDFGLSAKEPMYTSAIKDISKLEFLNNPQKYAAELARLTA